MDPTLYLDTEFTNLERPELLSLSLVSGDGEEHYVELDLDSQAGAHAVARASDFVLHNGVLEQWGTVPGAAASLEQMGKRTAHWVLEQSRRFGQPARIAFDCGIDYELFESLLRQADQWEQVRGHVAPRDINEVTCCNEADAASEACYAGMVRRGLARHHALADAHALRAACQAVAPNTAPALSSAIVFLDMDDVVCLNRRYGGYDVIAALNDRHDNPDDVFREVFDSGAMEVLKNVHDHLGGKVRYVISSTWREFFDRGQFEEIFRKAGVGFIGGALHGAWRTPSLPHAHRIDEVAAWLDRHHRGETFAIVDDDHSGASFWPALTNPLHPFAGRVLLCKEWEGLLPAHMQGLLKALQTPIGEPRGQVNA